MISGSDLERYARILAEVAHGQSELARVLARHGLDDAQWLKLSTACEAALDVPDETNDATSLERFSAAFAAAQAEFAGGPATFEEWLEMLSALQKGETLPSALERVKLTLDRYLTTQAHWAQQVAKDVQLNARLQAVLASPRRR